MFDMTQDMERIRTEFKRPVTPVGLRLVWLIPLMVAIDQASKAWVLYGINLPLREQVKILPFFSLTMVHNIGISFGLMASGGWVPWALTLFQLTVAGLLTWFLCRIEHPLLGLSFGLIAGGAIGNAIDRIRLGSVVDFLDFSGLHFPWVFNIADSCICVGVALLMWFFIRSDQDDGKKIKDGPDA